ncbi:phosphatidylserine decarboxylase family protein [Acetobacteroides hydrogenigenes]|uniref:Phosphatidylserine decarboxylase proenzyme n=1 Tax=Acetobacteroides hydrogenigenes TaxID=979970 RepID=A0A4V2RQW8_9BACT|nr:phosphatidylserine decarboxylase family protein [Acetobacteroides hydrogenigenes]TCN73141.1 phosphatidylserine decarboxylase [Acetobacteroides hydrogenigenes]
MRIHKEGHSMLTKTLLLMVAVLAILFFFTPLYVYGASIIVFGLLYIFLLRFFRFPHRPQLADDGVLYAPADGTVVVIEKTFEDEFFKDERIQVSIFMSVWNVHINWYPIKGIVEYFRHHHGKFMVAWHPKSSTENERTTVVINNGSTKILLRQIAGLLARRIVCYAKEGEKIEQNQQMGFIKFGSRVDIFLPVGTKVEVSLNQKTVGSQTVIARLK